MLLLGGELIPLALNFEAKGLADAVEQGEVVGVVFLGPGSDRRVHRQGWIGHHQLRREGAQTAQAVAVGASPVGGVKGEQPGRQLLHHRTVLRAGKVFGEHQLLGLAVAALFLGGLGQAIGDRHHVAAGGRGRCCLGLFGQNLDHGDALRSLQAGAEGVGQAVLQAVFFHQAIDHHLHVVAVVFVQLNVVGQLPDFPIHPHPHKALGGQAREQLFVGALLAPHHWRQQLKAGAIGQGHNPVDHLVDALGRNAAIAVGAVGIARPPVEQAQVVVDFGHRAHGGTGVVGGGFLVDGNGWTEPLDGIDIGLVDLAQKLAGVGAERLHVAALALGKNGVKGQG